MSPSLSVPRPRGRATASQYPSSLRPDNPYSFSPALLKAAKLPVITTDKYIFFFGYEGDQPEVCFQQWFPAPFSGPKDKFIDSETKAAQIEMVDFPTSEHFMMYHKALLMNDTDTATTILSADHPSEAKKLGRQVQNFDQEVWNNHANEVVEAGNWYKFSDERNKDMKEILLSTKELVIVEASPDDRIWGVGFDAEHAEGKEEEWGENGLGKALMGVRERLRKGEGRR